MPPDNKREWSSCAERTYDAVWGMVYVDVGERKKEGERGRERIHLLFYLFMH